MLLLILCVLSVLCLIIAIKYEAIEFAIVPIVIIIVSLGLSICAFVVNPYGYDFESNFNELLKLDNEYTNELYVILNKYDNESNNYICEYFFRLDQETMTMVCPSILSADVIRILELKDNFTAKFSEWAQKVSCYNFASNNYLGVLFPRGNIEIDASYLKYKYRINTSGLLWY